MPHGLCVISNPRSGRNRRNPGRIETLRALLADQGQLHQPPDLEALDRLAEQLHAERVDLVAVDGGDGTLHKVMGAFYRSFVAQSAGGLDFSGFPTFAILKGGTMNTNSRNLGVRRRALDMLAHVVACRRSGASIETTQRNLMVVDGQQVGLLFGTGVIARFLEAYYAEGPGGPLRAVQVLTQTVSSAFVGGEFARQMFSPTPCRVVVDESRWTPEAYAAVAAGTVEDIGLGFRPFYRCREQPDHMHVVGYACQPTAVAGSIHRIWMGRSPEHPDIFERPARRLVIDGAEPLSYVLDGDFLQGGCRLVVETGPSVRFVTG